MDRLADQNEALTEKYNAAQAAVELAQRAAESARRAATEADAAFRAARMEFGRMVAAQYERTSGGSTGALLTSQNPQRYLDRLNTLTLISTHRANLIAKLNATSRAASEARTRAATLLAEATSKRDAASRQRDTIVAQSTKFRSLLATLTLSQRQAYANRNAPTIAQVQAALQIRASSAAAQKAVDFALAQIGKPYVFAAAGPDAFDCSGLTMAAWAAAGVALPHFAATQYAQGRQVSQSQLQPGDLVFLYSDIHHVELYIGNGLAVSAPQEGEDVQIVRLAAFQSDYYGATRPG
ncbi:MAG: NlpC/P60 family protein [Actinomycetota bacterium]